MSAVPRLQGPQNPSLASVLDFWRGDRVNDLMSGSREDGHIKVTHRQNLILTFLQGPRVAFPPTHQGKRNSEELSADCYDIDMGQTLRGNNCAGLEARVRASL